MTLYIGVDFHPHQQTIAFCDTEKGEIERAALFHNPEKVRSFYEQLPNAVIGIEATCRGAWFEQLMEEFGHELRIGNSFFDSRSLAAQIRQKRCGTDS